MAANDFNLHDGFDIELPKPEDEYEGKGVPNANWLYLNATEAAKYRAKQVQTRTSLRKNLLLGLL